MNVIPVSVAVKDFCLNVIKKRTIKSCIVIKNISRQIIIIFQSISNIDQNTLLLLTAKILLSRTRLSSNYEMY